MASWAPEFTEADFRDLERDREARVWVPEPWACGRCGLAVDPDGFCRDKDCGKEDE